ncbi:MAG: hypothetical protein HFJ50_03945 [Clostridia bacterium]|jgi:cyclic beta-1,2-glucan synthetase|nr:hypothetical protein [Clostridia bacterium]
MNGILTINPGVSSSLKEYFVRYEFFSSVYNITVKNVSGRNDLRCIEGFKVNGEEIREKQIKLIDNGRIYEVEVLI